MLPILRLSLKGERSTTSNFFNLSTGDTNACQHITLHPVANTQWQTHTFLRRGPTPQEKTAVWQRLQSRTLVGSDPSRLETLNLVSKHSELNTAFASSPRLSLRLLSQQSRQWRKHDGRHIAAPRGGAWQKKVKCAVLVQYLPICICINIHI